MKLTTKKMSEISGLSEDYIKLAIDAKYLQEAHYSDGIECLESTPEKVKEHYRKSKENFKPDTAPIAAEKTFRQFLKMPRGQRLYSARTALEILKVSRGFLPDDPIPLSDQVELEKIIVKGRKVMRAE